jgi:alkanesulfonate monooxygenase SsuD/methylene tetrahydromethanopterin reductase-like flavin-dependent oxidoreductase (luciferase family)
LRPKIAKIRELAASLGRDPSSLKFFGTITPFIGETEEAAKAKLEEARKHASVIGGLALFSSWTGIDLSSLPVDEEIDFAAHSHGDRISTVVSDMASETDGAPKFTPRWIAEKAAFGALGPSPVGTAETVADEFQKWVEDGDLDGFNIAYVTTPGSFVDVVDLLVPELRRRGLYAEAPHPDDAPLTARERVYGKGQNLLRNDHVGASYRYDVYDVTVAKE